MKYEHKKQFEVAGFKEVEIIISKRYRAEVSERNIQNLSSLKSGVCLMASSR